MNDMIKVSIGDYIITSTPNKLITLGLGSCIGICIYDTQLKLGGLAHIMLPERPNTNKNFKKYADSAIPAMVEELISKGASKDRLEAKIIGGANMFEKINVCTENTIGYKNQISVKNTLSKLNIDIKAEELGGSIGRTVILDLETLKTIIKSKGEETEL